VSSHTLIASESGVNTKSENFDWSRRCDRLVNDFKSGAAAVASWLETRLRFKPQFALGSSQALENSDISVCTFV
jgi:hypothetical protein